MVRAEKRSETLLNLKSIKTLKQNTDLSKYVLNFQFHQLKTTFVVIIHHKPIIANIHVLRKVNVNDICSFKESSRFFR